MSTLKTNYNKHYKDLFMSDDPIPRFDVIKNSDFEPAIRQGIYEENDEIRCITNCISRPTFANTIEKLDSAGELLERVTDVFYNLLNAASDEEKEQLQQQREHVSAGKREQPAAHALAETVYQKHSQERHRNYHQHETKRRPGDVERVYETRKPGYPIQAEKNSIIHRESIGLPELSGTVIGCVHAKVLYIRYKRQNYNYFRSRANGIRAFGLLCKFHFAVHSEKGAFRRCRIPDWKMPHGSK